MATKKENFRAPDLDGFHRLIYNWSKRTRKERPRFFGIHQRKNRCSD